MPQLGILPHEIARQPNFTFNNKSYGSGPYRISKLQPDRIELMAHVHGFPKSHLKKITLHVIRDKEVALGLLKAKKMDAMELNFAQWRRFKSQSSIPEGLHLETVSETADFEFLVLNTEHSSIKDKNLRRALMYALDRFALCSGPMLDYCNATDFTSPLAGKSATNDLYQPDKALQLWKSVADRPKEITLLAFPDDRNLIAASWVAEQWLSVLGLKTSIKTMDFGPMIGTLMGGKAFEIAQLWVQPLVDIPEIWYLTWQPGAYPPQGRNIARFHDSFFTDQFNKLQSGDTKRTKTLETIEMILRDNPPAIPLYRRKTAWMISNRYIWKLGPVLIMELWTVQAKE